MGDKGDVTLCLLNPPAPGSSKNKIHFLDGLRGIAACVVVLDHWLMMGRDDDTTKATSVLWEPWFLRSPLRLLVDGGFAVAIFFVLSGYVLLLKYFQTWKKQLNKEIEDSNSINIEQPISSRYRLDMLYSGMVRRYPRLMIPAFVSLLLYYAWLHFGPFNGYSGCHAVGEMQNDIVTDDVTGGNYTVTFTIGDVIENGFIGQWTFEPAIYTIQWTLQIELIGSLVIFILAILLTYFCSSEKTISYRHYVYGVFFLVIPVLWWVGGLDLCPLPLQYLFTFILGMYFAEWEVNGVFQHVRDWREEDQANETKFKFLQWMLIVIGLYFGSCPYQQTLGKISDSMWLPLIWLSPWLWLSLGAGCIMFSLLVWKEFQELLSTPLCQTLGRLSFSIYLLHYQILILIDILIMPYIGPAMSPKGKHDRTGAAVFCLLFIIPLVYLVSVPFHSYCDELSVSLSNDFRGFFVNNKCFSACCGCLVEKKSVSTGSNLENGDLKQDATQETESVAQSWSQYFHTIDWKSKKMILLYATLLFIGIGAIPAKQYCDCYSSEADGGIIN